MDTDNSVDPVVQYSGKANEARKGPVAELVERCAALEQECAEHKDRYIRSLADFDNYRRRVQRDFEVVRHAAIEAIMADLLPVLDNFDRALATLRSGLDTGIQSADDDTQADSQRCQASNGGATGVDVGHAPTPGGAASEWTSLLGRIREGISLIRRQMYDVLGRHGLEEYSCLGEEFDPRRAEAVSFVHTDDHKPDTVVEEHCRGYSCRGKVIRPAKVVVAKQTGKSDERTK
ncbi:MAG: nucleotide exchange factor GrpE [candidate division WOR-3 bacterium]